MSKQENKSLAQARSTARQSKVDEALPIDPATAVVHASADPNRGTGIVSYDSISEADKRRLLIKSFAQNPSNPGVGPYGQVHLQDADLQYIDAQIKEQEAAHFDEWIANKVDWKNPAMVMLIRQVAPDFFERRMRYLGKVVDQQTNLAMMEARGYPATPEELHLLYMVDTGQIDIHPEGPHILVNKAPTTTRGPIERGWISHLLKPAVIDSNPDEQIKRFRTPYMPTRVNTNAPYGSVLPAIDTGAFSNTNPTAVRRVV